MLERVLAALNRPQQREDLQALCADLVRQNDALRLENARLRSENRHLRRRLGDRDLAIVRRAEADALLVGALHFGQLPTSRRACAEYGVSRRRWMWSNALLQVAGIKRQDGAWRDVPMEVFEESLQRAVRFVEGRGLVTLADRLPKNGWSGEHKSKPRPSSGHAQGHALAPRRDQ